MKLFTTICLSFFLLKAYCQPGVHFRLDNAAQAALWMNLFFSPQQMDAKLYRIGKDYKTYSLSVPCDSSIRLSVSVMSKYSFAYVFQCGDSVEISEGIDQLPYFRVIKRAHNENELNYGYISQVYLKKQPRKAGVSTKELRQQDMTHISYLLDSLYKGNLLTQGFYETTKQQLPFSVSSQLVVDYRMRHAAKIPEDSLIGVPLFQDSLAALPAYLGYMATYTRFAMLSKGKKIAGSTTCFDYVFDNHKGELQQGLLFIFLRNIYFEKKDSFNYFLSKYKRVATDPAKLAFYDDVLATEKADRQFTQLLAGKSGLLHNPANKDAISFSNFIKQHKGKVIFVDFWASWCTPCRAEMPFSKNLSDSFKGLPFVTAFISIDQSHSSWSKAYKELDLPAANNYLLLDAKKSPLVKMLKLDMIPRYLLIDKAGNIVDKDAKRPSDDQLAIQIKKLLQH